MPVRNHVRNGQIVFVTDARDNGNARGNDRLGNRFFIEGPQIFETAAAAPKNDQVDWLAIGRLQAIECPECRNDFLHRALALHADRADPYLNSGPATRQDFQHIADRGAGRTGDQNEPAWDTRQRLLAAWLEIALDRELFLELTKRQFQRADAFWLNFLNGELILAARLIHRKPAPRNDAHAIGQIEAHPQRDAAIEHRL